MLIAARKSFIRIRLPIGEPVESSNASAQEVAKASREQSKLDKKLESEHKRKEKALAEAAALLILQKSPGSLGESKDD